MSPVRAGNAALAVAAGTAAARYRDGAATRRHLIPIAWIAATARHPARTSFRTCRQNSD